MFDDTTTREARKALQQFEKDDAQFDFVEGLAGQVFRDHATALAAALRGALASRPAPAEAVEPLSDQEMGEFIGGLAEFLAAPAPVGEVEREELIEFLNEQLSDTITGPLSDTPYVGADVDDDGNLALYKTPNKMAFPDAGFDTPQMADALRSEFTVSRKVVS